MNVRMVVPEGAVVRPSADGAMNAAQSPSGVYLFDAKKVVPFLLAHRWRFALGALVGAALAMLYLMLATPIYTANAQLLIDPENGSVLQEQASSTLTSMDSQQVETQIAVLRSEEVARMVFQRFKLADSPNLKISSLADYLPRWFSSAASRAEAESIRQRRMLDKFREMLLVRRLGVSYAIDIIYTSSSPELAAQIANGFAESYMQYQLESRSGAARMGGQWLEQRLAELRQSMNASARRLQEHRASQDYTLSRRQDTLTGARAAAPPAESTAAVTTFEDLESTANTSRKLYETFLQLYMTAIQKQSFPMVNARIITRATPPLSQNRLAGLMIVMGALIGLAGAAASVPLGKQFSRPETKAEAAS